MQCSSSTRCKNGIAQDARSLLHAHSNIREDPYPLAAHHGFHASDLTYDIVLRGVPLVSEIKYHLLIMGAAAGSTFTMGEENNAFVSSLKILFSASLDIECGQLELRQEADVFCRYFGERLYRLFDICSLFVSAPYRHLWEKL